MIEKYVNKLVDDLPSNIININNPIELDIILDGGAFNGSYLCGALYFLKEMENRKLIKIDRISSCSVGSIAAFLYYIDALDYIQELYNIILCEFKQKYNLNIIKKLKILLKNKIPENICEKINKKIFISYNNLKTQQKIVKSKFKNIDDIFDTIIKSCFLPIFIDGNILYKKKYLDGFNPYIFSFDKKKCNKQILYLDLYGYDKISDLFSIKNEKSNCHRILTGMLDINCFYTKQRDTSMCSYVNKWNIIKKTRNFIRKILEKIILFVLYLFVLFNEYFPFINNNSIFNKLYKMIGEIIYELYVLLIQEYCI